MLQVYKWLRNVILVVVFFLVLGKLLTYFLPTNLLLNKAGFSQAIYTQDGHLLKLTLSSDDKYRLFVPLDQISLDFIQTILLQEDKYYYYHFGINPIGIIRGIWLTYLRGHRTGGSTISMQLARTRFGLNSRHPLGKLKQLCWSLALELLYSKSQILEAYLNLIPFGGNIEGIGAASLIYLKKQPSELTLAESYLLAAIPKSPVARNPVKFRENLKLAASELLSKDKSKRLQVSELQQVDLSGRPADLPKKALHLVSRVTKSFPFDSKLITTISNELQGTTQEQISNFIKKNRSVGI
ncbi:MAG: transglycosylase domain-containing protein, partial [Candidatus Paceibacterota bacterium]